MLKGCFMETKRELTFEQNDKIERRVEQGDIRSFGEKFMYFRLKLEMTKTEIAKKMQINRETYSELEKSQGKMTPIYLTKFINIVKKKNPNYNINTEFFLLLIFLLHKFFFFFLQA